LFNEQSIFSKWNADLYDQNEIGTDDVDFLLKVIGPAPKKVLEVSCGSGRILVPLAKAGHDVIGFDADEFMLAKIAAKAEGLCNITWWVADAVHDDWGSGYDVVVLAGNILYNIISDIDYAKAQELLIRKAAAALVPGGVVYIDYQPGNHLLHKARVAKRAGERTIWEGNDHYGNHGRMLLLDGSYDPQTRLSNFVRRFELILSTGETIAQDIPSVKHFAPLEQIRGWLRGAGFSTEREYGGYDGKPIGRKSSRAIIYAKYSPPKLSDKDGISVYRTKRGHPENVRAAQGGTT